MAKYELLIAVTDKKDAPGHARSKRGDIIAVRPHPWSWGAEEEKRFLVVVVDGITETPSNLCGPLFANGMDHDTHVGYVRNKLAEEKQLFDTLEMWRYPNPELVPLDIREQYILGMQDINTRYPDIEITHKRKFQADIAKLKNIIPIDDALLADSSVRYQPFKDSGKTLEVSATGDVDLLYDKKQAQYKKVKK